MTHRARRAPARGRILPLVLVLLPLLGLDTGVLGAQEAEAVTGPAQGVSEAPWPPVATFSIVGFDPGTGEVGVAVALEV
mgnify:CR=1 FL=1